MISCCYERSDGVEGVKDFPKEIGKGKVTPECPSLSLQVGGIAEE
jgi:hypothetical protein